MNAKKAKALRRLARKNRPDAPKVEYETITVRTHKGPANVLQCTPGCVRAHYKQLKKLHRRFRSIISDVLRYGTIEHKRRLQGE